jgi:hypothetical protein
MRDFVGVDCADVCECECVHAHVRMAGGASSGESRLRDDEEEVDELRVRLRGVTEICIGELNAGES